MKKVILMSSCALTLFLSSCNRDSFETSIDNPAENKVSSNQYSKDVSNDETLKSNLKIFYDQNKNYAERIGIY